MSSCESSLSEKRNELWLASGELNNIRVRISQIETEVAKLRAVRQKKDGLLGDLLGLTEQPESVRTRVAELERERRSLEDRSWDLERLESKVQGLETSLSRARLWTEKVGSAVQRKRRQKESVLNLRAAAASNSQATRRVGTTVKRRLAKQASCPYCGGPLGNDPHADHIYPVSKGGRSVPKNMVYVCSKCNGLKRDLTLAVFIRTFSLDRSAIERRLEELNKEY